jgi:hypothetical protein
VGVYLLIAAGAGFAVLFALNNLLKTIFRRAKVGFVDTLLAFLTTLVPLAGLILAQSGTDGDPRAVLGVLAIGGALAAFSLLILLLELFRPQRLKGSRGVMGLYSGLLIAAAVFVVPISHDLVTPATPTAIVQAVSAQGTEEATTADNTRSPATATDTPRPTNAATATLQPSDAPTATNAASATPSRTPFRFSTRTPTPTPTLVTPCVASVEYNLRLRAAPDKDAETLLTIPYGTTIDLFGKGTPSSDQGARWWFTVYQDTEGWVDGQYMLVSAACDRLPVKEAP